MYYHPNVCDFDIPVTSGDLIFFHHYLLFLPTFIETPFARLISNNSINKVTVPKVSLVLVSKEEIQLLLLG